MVTAIISGKSKSFLVDTCADMSILREAVPGSPVGSVRVTAKVVTGVLGSTRWTLRLQEAE